MRRIVIVGLPASGKTTLGHQLAEETGLPFYDDATQLPDHDGFIITHPQFCDPKSLTRVITAITTQWGNPEVLYFENNPQQAHINAKHRTRRVAGLIDRLSQLYNPQTPTYPVYRENASAKR